MRSVKTWLALAVTLAVASLTSPSNARACEPVLLPEFFADAREVSQGPAYLGDPVHEGVPGGTWWVHRRGASGVVFEPQSEGTPEPVVVLVTESSFAIRVPEGDPGASWHAVLVEPEYELNPLLLSIVDGEAIEEIALPEMQLVSVESDTFLHIQGCGGFSPVQEISFATALIEFDQTQIGRLALQLWNLPTGEELDSENSPTVVDVAPVPNELLQGNELQLATTTVGTRTLFVRLVDRRIGTAGEILKVDLPLIDEPTQVGNQWTGFGCSEVGPSGQAHFAVWLALAALARRTSRTQRRAGWRPIKRTSPF
jgi:hypothetical protein